VLEDGLVAVVVLVFVVSFVSFVFSVGFTTVVLFSTFLSGAGDVAVVGVTTVLSSQPPRSAAVAKMQISFFIILDWLPIWDIGNSNGAEPVALPKRKFRRQLQRPKFA
jgi:hypothetical protein